jgi:response regulator RpfG family c-di-GMP phosphodiesterase
MKRIHVAWMTVVLWPERRMRQSVIGGSIIKPIKFLPNGDKITRHHHERFNDGG